MAATSKAPALLTMDGRPVVGGQTLGCGGIAAQGQPEQGGEADDERSLGFLTANDNSQSARFNFCLHFVLPSLPPVTKENLTKCYRKYNGRIKACCSDCYKPALRPLSYGIAEALVAPAG